MPTATIATDNYIEDGPGYFHKLDKGGMNDRRVERGQARILMGHRDEPAGNITRVWYDAGKYKADYELTSYRASEIQHDIDNNLYDMSIRVAVDDYELSLIHI